MSFLKFAVCISAVLPLCTALTMSDLSTSASEVQKAIVDKHNALRRSVTPTASNMLKMSWSDEAASNALSWAQTCSGMHSESQQRTINGMRCGENLFMASDLSAWEKGIQDWYNEVQNLTYNVGRAGVVGHYTQVVWYRSNLVGCAIAHCPDEELFHYFYVCHYCPPGNYADSLYTPYKAGPPCGDCPNSCEDKLCNNPCELFDKSSSCKQMLTKYKNGCQYEPIQSMCAASCGCGDKIY